MPPQIGRCPGEVWRGTKPYDSYRKAIKHAHAIPRPHGVGRFPTRERGLPRGLKHGGPCRGRTYGELDTDADFYVRRRGFPNLSEQIAKKVEMRTTGYYSVGISRMRRSNDSRGV